MSCCLFDIGLCRSIKSKLTDRRISKLIQYLRNKLFMKTSYNWKCWFNANCNFLEAATFIPFLWDKRNQSWKDFFPLLSQRKKERILPLLKSCIQLHLCRLLIDQHSCFCSQTFRRFNEFALKGSSLTFLLRCTIQDRTSSWIAFFLV